jgi:hypothetical protein
VEEGWVGIASVIWALLISIWVVLADRVVTWGKHEEEERLTGRSETRRTLTEWLSVLISTIVLVVIAAVAVLMTATLILRARDASLAPPGEKYYVDGKHNFFKCKYHSKSIILTWVDQAISTRFIFSVKAIQQTLWAKRFQRYFSKLEMDLSQAV